jgi:NAD(P)-dependent dehydrogenase (short-subunit alcohol dehydrogenase family)
VGLAGRYAGKVTIVTGGSKGIGEGCTRVFFAAGSNVVFCARGEKEGEALEVQLNSLNTPNKALFVKTDISDTDQIKHMIGSCIQRFGRLDCIINNAG